MLNWTKIFSGRWIFTVVTALVFAFAVYSNKINGEQIYGIIMLVIAFYFSKNPEQQTKEKENGNV